MIAVYAGSFDPITRGHQDLISRASTIFEQVFVVVGVNPSKKGNLLGIQDRVNLIDEVCKGLPNVEATFWEGPIVDFCMDVGARVLLRGLRAVTDFEVELGMSQVNARLEPDIQTLFMPTSPEFSFVSSSTVRELIRLGKDISYYVHPAVEAAFKLKPM
jgi:pantetheine-phosphate adenylyltransferase